MGGAQWEVGIFTPTPWRAEKSISEGGGGEGGGGVGGGG